MGILIKENRKCNSDIWTRIGLAKDAFQKVNEVRRNREYSWGTKNEYLNAMWYQSSCERCTISSQMKWKLGQKCGSLEGFNSVDVASKQRGSVKENANKRTVILRIRKKSWTYNKKVELEKINSHRAYWGRERHGRATSQPPDELLWINGTGAGFWSMEKRC